jgi:acyl carrier protein
MIENKVRSIMAKVFGISDAEITADTSNETLERWDSLGHMNLCLALEEEFGIELDGERVAEMTSYPKVVAAVSSLAGGK